MALGRVNNPVEARRTQALSIAGIALEDVDVGDPAALRRAFDGADQVFHLAAAQHEANVGEDYYRRINVDGTRNVLEAALAAGVSRVVHGSTIGVFGSAMAGELSETSPTRPGNHYGAMKLDGERVALGYNGEVPVTAIRISETYGPGDNRLLKLFKAIDRKRFFMIGPGTNVRQLIYVDDLIDGMFLAATSERSPGEVIVLAGSETLTTRQTVDTIAAALGVEASSLRVPMWPFVTMAMVMEKTLTPVGIQPPLHRRRLDVFRKSFYFSLQKARDLLGFTPQTTFADGARDTATWYRENGLL